MDIKNGVYIITAFFEGGCCYSSLQCDDGTMVLGKPWQALRFGDLLQNNSSGIIFPLLVVSSLRRVSR